MLLPARYLVDRLRHGRSRADEVNAVRRRLAALAGAGRPSAEEVALGAEMRRLREALHEALSGVESCSGCARGHPLPHGRWSGGHCCGTRTEMVFTDEEIGALRAGGTTPAQLALPAGDQAGCAFRGPAGCSLAAADRPNICVRYICRELEEELDGRGDRRPIKALARELGKAFERWRSVHAARLAAKG